MLKYPCLVLDHDDTVVQTMKTQSHPFFCYVLEQFRPGETITLEEYAKACHDYGFVELCRLRYGFTEEELSHEHRIWKEYVLSHTPEIYPGIDRIIRRQKEEGGLVCVVSHSGEANIARDYLAHIGFLPDVIYGWDLPEDKRKPNPYPLLDIMEKYDLKPSDLLLVDDMKLGVNMAKPLGVAVAFAAWDDMGVPELRAEMAKLCDYQFNSVEDLETFLFEV